MPSSVPRTIQNIGQTAITGAKIAGGLGANLGSLAFLTNPWTAAAFAAITAAPMIKNALGIGTAHLKANEFTSNWQTPYGNKINSLIDSYNKTKDPATLLDIQQNWNYLNRAGTEFGARGGDYSKVWNQAQQSLAHIPNFLKQETGNLNQSFNDMLGRYADLSVPGTKQFATSGGNNMGWLDTLNQALSVFNTVANPAGGARTPPFVPSGGGGGWQDLFRTGLNFAQQATSGRQASPDDFFKNLPSVWGNTPVNVTTPYPQQPGAPNVNVNMGGQFPQTGQNLPPWLQFLFPALTATAGGLTNRPSWETTTLGGTETQTGSTSRQVNLSPEMQAFQNSLVGKYTDLMNKDPDLTGYASNQMSDINRQYGQLADATRGDLAARGIAGSPMATAALNNLNNQRFAANVNLRGQLPLLQRSLQESALTGATNFFSQMPQFLGETTTSTSTLGGDRTSRTDRSGNILGGAFTGGAEALAALMGMGTFNRPRTA